MKEWYYGYQIWHTDLTHKNKILGELSQPEDFWIQTFLGPEILFVLVIFVSIFFWTDSFWIPILFGPNRLQNWFEPTFFIDIK